MSVTLRARRLPGKLRHDDLKVAFEIGDSVRI
jgi:hypothetical protein